MSKKLSIIETLVQERLLALKQVPVFKLEDHLFKEQLAFVQDGAPFKTAVCSRRSGKSTGCAADLVYTAHSTPDCTALYVTGARTDAKKIVWSEIKKFNKRYAFGGVANESDLTMEFSNGSVIRLSGAKDMAAVDKIRGQMPPVKKAYIDEAQGIKDSLLEVLVDDVLEPALLDYDGSLCLIGTPGAVPSGYFYEASQNPKWANHAWTFFNNPHIARKSNKTHQQLLDRVLTRRGVDLKNPSIRREYFGEWVVDADTLVYKYKPAISDWSRMEPGDYNYIIGIDVGYEDADAIAVLAWSVESKNTYLIEEMITRRQGITELANQIKGLQAKYNATKMVIDAGALGKKIAEELTRRHGLPLEAADKTRKIENIELLNDDLRTGRLKIKKESQFAQDSLKIEWDHDKSTPDKKIVSDNFHSDICDAVLYGWRASLAFAHEAPKPKPKYGTLDWQNAEAERIEAEALEHFERQEDSSKDPFSNF